MLKLPKAHISLATYYIHCFFTSFYLYLYLPLSKTDTETVISLLAERMFEAIKMFY